MSQEKLTEKMKLAKAAYETAKRDERELKEKYNELNKLVGMAGRVRFEKECAYDKARAKIIEFIEAN